MTPRTTGVTHPVGTATFKTMKSVPVAMLLALGGALGCPNAQERNPDLPLLTNLTFEGVARDNAQVLLFNVKFRDEDGDLGAGSLNILINDKSGNTDPIPMEELFRKSGLPSNASEGTLLFELQVDIPADERPAAGSMFTIGVEARDGSSNQSNRPTVRLEINY